MIEFLSLKNLFTKNIRSEILYIHICLPQEIDDLELTLTQAKKAFRYVDEKNFILDITLI